MKSPKSAKYRTYRVQTGVRIDKRLLKVLKSLAHYLEITLGEAVELCVLASFEPSGHFSKPTQQHIKQLCEIYGIEYGLEHVRLRQFSGG